MMTQKDKIYHVACTDICSIEKDLNSLFVTPPIAAFDTNNKTTEVMQGIACSRCLV
ncbi:hypothetical protein COO91_02064 [Nostoc flagelliforme CCNUN1]|uniref:Uncharacterized protein n=1 Tax=Nostoc flagelliforme CCNUN1 TaxID=2038116 RepID=A0A2K8SLI8_9NOSO|nr:hypothetical protein COO91_02064 [Nostoc flagelliforme CCNUN1]